MSASSAKRSFLDLGNLGLTERPEAAPSEASAGTESRGEVLCRKGDGRKAFQTPAKQFNLVRPRPAGRTERVWSLLLYDTVVSDRNFFAHPTGDIYRQFISSRMGTRKEP